ncbi:MAG: metallophosphoesterase [Cyanobacteria bacterium REEB417]|nr:metallophosphoesterase [Cyanobacteria bacterium REEB417]
MKRRRLLQLLGWSLLGGWAGRLGAGVNPARAQLQPNAQSPPPPPPSVPGAGSGGRVHVLATADFGSGNRQQRGLGQQMAALHRRDPVELVILGGDNIYAGPGWRDGDLKGIEATFERPYRELIAAGVPFHAVLGNHDIRTANGNPQLSYPGFGMRGRWYGIRRGPIEFFMLDTNGNADWTLQLRWLNGALMASNALWKVVVGHHPIYSAGHYGDDARLMARLAPILARHGVQLYINGHDHNYERTRAIAGTTFLTIGGGGASLRPVKANSRTAMAASVHSFVELIITERTLTINAIDSRGQPLDNATLRR